VVGNECSATLVENTKYNPDLKPETSKGYSFGLIFEPVKGYETTLDYFNIDRSNVIGLQAVQQLVNMAANGMTPAGSTVIRRPFNPATDQTFQANDAQINPPAVINDFTYYGVNAGALQGVSRSVQNITEQKTSGVDVAFKGTQKLGSVGTLHEILDATYTINFYDTSVSDLSDNLAGSYGVPRVAGSLTLVLDVGSFSHSLRFNYTGATTLQSGYPDTNWSAAGCANNNYTADQCQVRSNRTTDYAVSYIGIKNLILGANVINLFQQRAPIDIKASGGVNFVVPNNLQDAMGRMLNLSANYKFK